jgi:two-component system chemotaxis response regulator CheB
MAVADRIVALGASAGGLDALAALVAGLPPGLPAAVLVVIHLPAEGASRLPEILERAGPLPAAIARQGERLLPGRIYAAVNDRHLLVKDGHVLLSRAPKQNRSRPAVDALFRSAARWYRSRAIGVVLSGALDDGTAGLAAIVALGGAALVQDPREAVMPAMPTAALAVVPEAVVAPAARLGDEIRRLVGQPPARTDVPIPNDLMWETRAMEDPMLGGGGRQTPGTAAAVSCPDCSGGMNVVTIGSGVHYVCHVGHAWSPQALADAQHEKIEQALWTAVSMLEEEAAIHRKIAELAARGGAHLTIRHQLAAAEESLHAAAVIRANFPDLLPASPEPETTPPPSVSITS